MTTAQAIHELTVVIVGVLVIVAIVGLGMLMFLQDIAKAIRERHPEVRPR